VRAGVRQHLPGLPGAPAGQPGAQSNSLVGIEQAPNSLSVVTGIGSLLAIVGNPFFGRMSDRTSSRLGMRRPWMVIGLVGFAAGPEFVWELSLGIYLMVKGFKPSPITTGMAAAGAPPAYHEVDA
jgi:MFS family permease